MKRIPSLTEAKMRAAEARIPELAAEAGRAAHQRALSQAGKVVKVANGAVIEQHADGSSRVIELLPPATKVRKGLVLVRRAASR